LRPGAQFSHRHQSPGGAVENPGSRLEPILHEASRTLARLLVENSLPIACSSATAGRGQRAADQDRQAIHTPRNMGRESTRSSACRGLFMAAHGHPFRHGPVQVPGRYDPLLEGSSLSLSMTQDLRGAVDDTVWCGPARAHTGRGWNVVPPRLSPKE